ncbi:hypothetical protein [Acinetobacter sp.]|uniref:hypothetical protein n=1 Tax=Acinetobacter sp. TaxID=472 RepID=UPI0038908F3C
MTKSMKNAAVATTATEVTVKGRVLKSFEQKLADTAKATAERKRFSFGPVWNKGVIDGTVTDHAKLVEQAVKLKVNARSDAKRLKFETLRQKVAAELVKRAEAEAAEKAEQEAADTVIAQTTAIEEVQPQAEKVAA